MATPDLRPMSVGEILDRTASLYRNNFVLFFAISLIPHLLVLAWVLTQLAIQGPPPRIEPRGLRDIVIFAGIIVEYEVAYLFTQGPTAFAVSGLYFGRRTSARGSFAAVIRRLGRLTRGVLLSGFTLFAGTLFFLLPGVFLACRLLVALPAAALEDLGARESFERSFSLTRHHAGRALGVYSLVLVLRLAAFLLILYPSRLVAEFSRVNPAAAIPWRQAVAVANVSLATLIDPFLTIAATVFYFDLRVRKEALDLQVMMSAGENLPAKPANAPSI
jgi:hypothetical protein